MFGALLSAISSVVSTVVSAVSSLGISALKAVGKLITTIAKALGLIKPEATPEELGDKAIQSGYTPEEFDSYAAYAKAVEAFEVDPEKSKTIDERDKTEKGIELSSGLIAEKFDGQPVAELLVGIAQNPEAFSEVQMHELAKVLIQSPGMVESIAGYITGSEKNDVKNGIAIDALLGIQKATNPGISDFEALKAVMTMRP